MTEVSGRKEGDTSLEDRSIQVLCFPCKEEEADTLADGFCTECEQHMCKTCFRHHRKGKFCKDHSLIDLNQTKDTLTKPGHDKVYICQEHKEETLKLYCSTHEVVCCKDCIIQKHRSCEIHYFSEKADGFQSSEEFETFTRDIEYCTREIISCKASAHDNGTEFEGFLSKCKTNIKMLREEVNAWFDEQERNILKRAEEIKAQSDANIVKVENTCEELENTIVPVDEAIKSVANQSSKLFVIAVKNKPTLKHIREEVEKLKMSTRYGKRNYTFKRSPKIEELISHCIELGTLECSVNSDVDFSDLEAGNIFKISDTIPLRAKTDQKNQPVDETDDKVGANFKDGDKVRIKIGVDVLKMIEDNRGAWSDQMAECIEKTGVVIVSKGDDITVDFESAGRWTFHGSVLNKVREFVPGEVVKVNGSIDHVRMLQTDRGGWNELMDKIIGKKGTVEEIDEDGDIQVSFGDYTWTFNPECLSPADGKADLIRQEND